MIDFNLNELIGEEFLGKATVLAVLTSIVMSLKGIPIKLWRRIERLIVFSVTIEQTDELFEYVERWLQDNCEKKQRNVIANINYVNFALSNGSYCKDEVCVSEESSNEPEITQKEEVTYRHESDIMYIRKDGVFIKVNKGREKLENAKNLTSLFFDRYVLSTIFAKKKLKKLIDEIVEYNQQFKVSKKHVEIKSYREYYGWSTKTLTKSKSVDKVIMNQEDKDFIVNDLDKFLSKRKWYDKRSILYKRGYLFEGPPGNGKTSFSAALASHFMRDIYIISLSEMHEDSSLRGAVEHVKENSILLLEDIDASFKGKRETESKGLSFSGLLNCLDGLYSKEGIITIMTTNHPEKLDPALIRPGRIDVRYHFANPVKSMVKEYIELFYEQEIDDFEYIDESLSMATIQGVCLQNDESVENALKEITSKSLLNKK